MCIRDRAFLCPFVCVDVRQNRVIFVRRADGKRHNDEYRAQRKGERLSLIHILCIFLGNCCDAPYISIRREFYYYYGRNKKVERDSVSYTHLDVYKRQVYRDSMKFWEEPHQNEEITEAQIIDIIEKVKRNTSNGTVQILFD